MTLSEFFLQVPPLTYDKGQIIIHGQDEPSGVFFIEEGFVRMSSILENGKEITLSIFTPNTFFPLIWTLTDKPNPYFYQTVTPVTLHRVAKKDFLQFVSDNPDVLMYIIKKLLLRMRSLLIDMEHQLSGNSYQRVATTLFLAAKRYNGSLKFTHKELADMAGLTRETVSLAIAKLAKKKIILYKKRELVIKNLEALETEANIDIENL